MMTTGVQIRILFAFDPWRSAIPLVTGDKPGREPVVRRGDPAGRAFVRDLLEEWAEEGAAG
jgi:hypothetical protein